MGLRSFPYGANLKWNLNLMPYVPTNDAHNLDGVVRYLEEPTAEVKAENATFFAFTNSTNAGIHRESFQTENVRMLSYSREGWGRDSPYRELIPLPRPVPNWQMLFYSFPPTAIAPHLSDFSIAGARAHWMTDFSATHLGLIVSERAKAVIEEIDPGMHYFFPMKITVRETGEFLPTNRFYWKPRRTFKFEYPPPAEAPGHARMPFPTGSAFQDPQIAWDLQNNTILRNFLKTLPFWSLDSDQLNFGMRPDVFARLKSELFTGLIEIVGGDKHDPHFDRNANIGHF